MNGNAVPPDEDPMLLWHLRLIRILMLSVGSWPEEAVRRLPRKVPLYTAYMVLEAVTIPVGEIIYLGNWFHELNFFILGNIYITLSLSFLVVFRTLYPFLKKYGEIFRAFLSEFHLRHFRNKDEHAENIYQVVNKISNYYTVYMTVLSVSGVVTFNVAPFFKNYKAGQFRDHPPENITLEYSIHYEYPGFKQNDHLLLVTMLNIWFSYVCGFLITIMDLFLCLIVFQIIGHLRYLRTTLEHFPRPMEHTFSCGVTNRMRLERGKLMVKTLKHFDAQENELISKKITTCIEHHLVIVNFTDNISDFFGPLLAMNYMYHLVSLSILLVECMQGGDAYMHYGSLTLMTLAQLTQQSIVFEVVHSESLKLIDAVYMIPWESMSVSNQKSVCLMLRRVQTPIAVTAMGMTAVGVQTMAGILKTSFSYCAFLNSMNN